MRYLWMMITWLIVWGILSLPNQSSAADFVVYSVYRALDLGNAGEPPPPKDYYINMGSAQGLSEGSLLSVYRRMATYDLLSEKLYKEVMFPIAKLKVIHVEQGVAIARMDQMIVTDKMPAITPVAVMVGDLVRPAQ